MAGHHAVAFGLRWSSDVPLHGFARAEPGIADVVVARAATPVDRRAIVPNWHNGAIFADGFRYPANHAATFDCFDGRRLTWWPGPDWDGALPRHAFSTVVALVMAWRGALPMHATAVEIDGKAVLLCGRSGAGKSTLAAGLVGLGARLISDDLTVIVAGDGVAAPVVHAGRPTVRLFANTAEYLRDVIDAPPVPDFDGKLKLTLPAPPPFAAIPVAAVALLEPSPQLLSAAECAAMLPQHMFRPRWMTALPEHRQRLTMLHDLAGTAKLLALPSEDVRDAAIFWRRAESSLAVLRKTIT